MKEGKRLAKVGILAALALITFMVEGLLPPLLAFAPGTRIGLASVFVNICLILYGEKYALLVLLTKCILGSVFSGNMFSLYYSLPAGALSLLASIALYRLVFPKVSVVFISVVSAVLHNITQIAMASILLGAAQALYYAPMVTVAGTIAGIITGISSYYIIKALPERAVYS